MLCCNLMGSLELIHLLLSIYSFSYCCCVRGGGGHKSVCVSYLYRPLQRSSSAMCIDAMP